MKLLIIDDHSIVRAGLAALLARPGSDIVVVQAATTAEGMTEVDTHPDLDAVFLDLNMPGESGMSALREIGRRRPDLPVILLSSSEDPADVRRALAAGAFGYVPKSSSPQTLMSVLKLVLSGEVYVPPLMLKEAASNVGGDGLNRIDGSSNPLTDRQIDVLRLLARGLSNKEIGRELLVAERTVKAHVTAIFKAFGVSNRAQAVDAARLAALI
ncbi:response regulator transcription factor [Methylocapsa sp. S129]|uniref:response regulator transcription factor n=1 Tax=Methylocapsa sp. S129 TaxID=1641869 RepID=UPI00131E9CD3|nr:response regulator transcription factor [Methylocapsa sp. S129]